MKHLLYPIFFLRKYHLNIILFRGREGLHALKGYNIIEISNKTLGVNEILDSTVQSIFPYCDDSHIFQVFNLS